MTKKLGNFHKFNRTVFLSFSSLFTVLLFVALCDLQAASATQVHGKAVAVVYDDSGSMQQDARWVRANYALKVLAASLRAEDSLQLVWMSNPKVIETYDGVVGIDRAIAKLNAQKTPSSGTPYQSLKTAVSTLVQKKSSGLKLWLVVISDGGFNEINLSEVTDDAQLALNAGIRAVFIPIQQADRSVALEWQRVANASVEDAKDGAEVVTKIVKVAALLNGQSDQGVRASFNDHDANLTAIFPLRSVAVVRQDSDTAVLDQVLWQQQNLSIAALRKHEFPPNEMLRDMPTKARIYHLHPPNNAVIPAGKQLAMRFGSDAKNLNLKFLPDVAAHYSVRFRDVNGKAPIQKGADGKFLVCDTNYEVAVELNDDAGKTLLANRADSHNFRVTAKTDGKDLQFAPGTFVQRVVAGQWGSEAVVSVSMEYPGYLYEQSAPAKIVFGGELCKKSISMKVQSGLDDGGFWRSEINRIERAPSVHIGVTVDGKPAAASQMKSWVLDEGKHKGLLDVHYLDGEILVKPKQICCVWWWSAFSVGNYIVTLEFKTNNPHDDVKGVSQLKFNLVEPVGLWSKVWWYGCPFFVLVASLVLLWYVLRLLRKARFERDARLETEEKSKDDYDSVVRPKTVVLREECSAVLRWIWPSRAEVMEYRGIRFYATREGELRVDGRDLLPKHKVPGWVFDRSRVDAIRAKDRRQDDAILGDNNVMKIDEGSYEIVIRYKA